MAACSGGGDGESVGSVIDVEPAPQAEARPLNPEVGTALAQGALFKLHDDPGAEPLPVRFDFGTAQLGDQAVLRADIVVEVTIDGERVEREWRVLVGTAADGRLAALRASER